jgi:hypothetical protein
VLKDAKKKEEEEKSKAAADDEFIVEGAGSVLESTILSITVPGKPKPFDFKLKRVSARGPDSFARSTAAKPHHPSNTSRRGTHSA